MGEEIEIYILKKLDDAIRESKASSEFHFAARLFLPKLHKEFTELKELIEKKRTKIKLAAAAPRPRPAVRDPAANVTEIPDASKPSSSAMTGSAATSHDSSIPASTSAGGDKKDSKVLPDAGAKKSEAPPDAGDEKDRGSPPDADDEKLSGAPLAGGSEKESASDAGDKKEIGTSKNAGDEDTNAPLDASDKKETDAPSDDDAGDKKETDAPSDDDAGDKKETDAPSDDDAGDKKETDAPSDDDAGDKKETDAPSDAVDDDKKEPSINSDAVDGEKKESDAPSVDGDNDESKASAPATASVTSSGGKKESNVGVSAKTVSQNESEISPATDTVTGDKSVTPPAPAGDGEKESNAFKTTTSAKTTSSDESEISPVTDTGAPDHKSKTPSTSAGDGKKESGVPPADKSNTTNASTKSDSNTKPVSEEVLLREQLYYLNNVLTEWQMISKKPFSYSSDSVFSIKDLSKTLRKIKLDLKPEKTDESSHAGTPPTASIGNASLTRTTPQVVEFRWSTRVNLNKVHGFEDKILSLERLLVLRRKDTDTFKAFGIHGMAGVGKTTLCQSIFSRPKVTEYFFPRIWVCLSKQKGEDEDNRKEVVKRMLRGVGIDDKIINKVDEKQSMRGLLFALRLQLTGKRYFIVLDDAHNPDEWFKMPDTDAENDNNKIYEKFSYGLPKECGGTVIVTSRVEQVVKNMVGEEENLRCIEPLTDQETCWKIFKDTVQEGETPFPQDLEKLKAEIVKRCDGLPLAAKLLGQIKHKELRENPAAAINHRAAIEAGNQQAAV